MHVPLMTQEINMDVLRNRIYWAGVASLMALGLMGEARAQSVYAGVGSTGLNVGAGWVPNEVFGARIEVGWLPRYDRSFSEDGIDYFGTVRGVRGALLFDWHVARGGFRVTAGVSGNDYRGQFTGVPALGRTLSVGGAEVTLGPADQYAVQIKLPALMGYWGIGWGHTRARGWGVHADLGVLVGSPRVRGSLTPQLADQIAQLGLDPQAELNRELRTVRDAVDRIAVYPILAVGVSYRW
jgi:hypothetical protein